MRKDNIGKKMNEAGMDMSAYISIFVGGSIYLKALGYDVDIPMIALFIMYS